MARTKDLRVPCSDEEREEIARKAAAVGLPEATWLRRLALGQEVGATSSAPDHTLTAVRAVVELIHRARQGKATAEEERAVDALLALFGYPVRVV